MAYFIDESGTYLVGDIEYERSQGRICIEVPQSPGQFYDWNGEKWVLNGERVEAEKQAETKQRIIEKLPEILLNLTDKEGFEKVKQKITEIKQEVDKH